MVINRETTYIRAFDNRDAKNRIVINYSSVALFDTEKTWSAVDKFFVMCRNTFFYIKVDECKLISQDNANTDIIENNVFKVQKIGKVGQREILFETKSNQNKFKMLFEHRNKSLRIIKNNYLTQNIKGSLFKRNHVVLDSLEFIERI
ncbi:MAG: hypothetical protein CBC02_009930 [Flavobacteriaceae bacterium TMED42]|nr:MAG: hypothetical protein CBC02_009930 [Flavobacteriaceae bacterium TMED42]